MTSFDESAGTVCLQPPKPLFGRLDPFWITRVNQPHADWPPMFGEGPVRRGKQRSIRSEIQERLEPPKPPRKKSGTGPYLRHPELGLPAGILGLSSRPQFFFLFCSSSCAAPLPSATRASWRHGVRTFVSGQSKMKGTETRDENKQTNELVA